MMPGLVFEALQETHGLARWDRVLAAHFNKQILAVEAGHKLIRIVESPGWP